MAITIVGTPQIGGTNNGGDVTLTFDGTPAEDDVVVVFGGHTRNDTIGPSTSGYTALHTLTGGGAQDQRFGVWYKVLGATPDSTVVCQGGGAGQSAVVYGCYVLRGVDTSNVSDATPTAAGITTTAPPDNPSITTATDGTWVLATACDALNVLSDIGTITSYGNTLFQSAADTDRFVAGAATREITTAGAEDPAAWSGGDSGSADKWYTVTAAIRPASAGTNVPLGQIVETETAQTATVGKNVALSQPSETETAQPVTARKIIVLGQAVEVETAQPVGVGGTMFVPLGLVVETGTAQSFTVHWNVPLGQSVETELAQTAAIRKNVTLGQPVEIEITQPVSTLEEIVFIVGSEVATTGPRMTGRDSQAPRIIAVAANAPRMTGG